MMERFRKQFFQKIRNKFRKDPLLRKLQGQRSHEISGKCSESSSTRFSRALDFEKSNSINYSQLSNDFVDIKKNLQTKRLLAKSLPIEPEAALFSLSDS